MNQLSSKSPIFEAENLKKLEREIVTQLRKFCGIKPKGMTEEARRNNKSTDPMLLSHLYGSVPDWNEMEFIIKWKG
ncbi:hypothetical protein T459_30164 [Capsicum annuum]|uniref:Uncharacterized protein n=1 Tax=Capsicum annuum TaxID=4072 RepID=A0A2G2Y7S5_CAPAN|nr:hypothetical protein T459_30164 [Capsicum annuum]